MRAVLDIWLVGVNVAGVKISFCRTNHTYSVKWVQYCELMQLTEDVSFKFLLKKKKN